jgi:hypothetical protein
MHLITAPRPGIVPRIAQATQAILESRIWTQGQKNPDSYRLSQIQRSAQQLQQLLTGAGCEPWTM